jgi:hypothetical protein
MTLSPTRLRLAGLLALLAAAAPARAEVIPWDYTVSSSTGLIPSDSGVGSINMLPASGSGVNGIKDVLAAQLQTVGSNTPQAPANFTNAPYSLTISLHDQMSNKTGALTFGGVLNGSFTAGSADIKNTFNSLAPQQVTLGTNTYTVTMGSFVPPGAPTTGPFGRITADVIVSGGGPQAAVSDAPEPGALALAAIGAGALIARRCRGRRSATSPPSGAQATA